MQKKCWNYVMFCKTTCKKEKKEEEWQRIRKKSPSLSAGKKGDKNVPAV